jgi:hypothetical protein
VRGGAGNIGAVRGAKKEDLVKFRLPLAALILLVVLSNVGGAAAAPASTTFTVVGYEYAFTSTLGCFAGTARGTAGDRGTWSACVQHEPLGSSPTPSITGGRLVMATRSPTGAFDAVTGSFVFQGGTIETMNSGPNCTNQEYLVSGSLQDVATTTTSGGSGTFSVILTHYRTSLFGRCIIYAARVSGTASFTY